MLTAISGSCVRATVTRVGRNRALAVNPAVRHGLTDALCLMGIHLALILGLAVGYSCSNTGFLAPIVPSSDANATLPGATGSSTEPG